MTVGERTLGVPGTRADEVRARRVRNKRSVERPGKLKEVKPKRSRRMRRRYDLELSREHNTQIQLTALPAGYVGQRIFSAVVIMLAVMGLIRFFHSPGYEVGIPEITGLGLLTPAQVRSIAGIEGTSIFQIDPAVVEAKLEEAAEVSEAYVTLAWPNKVRIDLKEREPAAAWDDAGRIWWLSADGVAYIQHGVMSNLVNIFSEEPSLQFGESASEPVIDPEVIAAATALKTLLPQVSGWAYDKEHGLGFQDPHGWMGYFGHGGDVDLKVEVYNALVRAMEADGITASIVSVENPAAPYYARD